MSGPVHPLDRLADRYGDRGAALMLVVSVLVPLALLPTDHPAGPVILGLGVVCYATSEGLDLTDPGLSDLERAQRLYQTGDITLDEFERRAELLLDERKQRLRGLAEEINGVGPATSADLAREFDSPDDLRRATPEDLKQISGIGPATAEKIGTQLGKVSETVEAETDPLAEV